jgi:hypothetical protein
MDMERRSAAPETWAADVRSGLVDEQTNAPAPGGCPRKPYELGVVFVHGIGQQTRGSTLVQAGDSLIFWLRRWIGGARSKSAGSAPDPALDPHGDVRLPDAAIRIRLNRPQEPPYAELCIRMPGDGTEDGRAGSAAGRFWLLCESWWADAFAPSQFAEFFSWSLRTVPWTFASHFGTAARRWTKRLWRQYGDLVDFTKALVESHRGTPLYWVYFPVAFLGVLLGLVLNGVIMVAGMLLAGSIVAILSLFAIVSTLVLLLIALPPVPQLRAVARSLQQMLSATVGDSHVLVTSPVQATAIVTQVRNDLQWLADRSETVAVVAHSQGAAVAHEALRQGLPRGLPPDRLLLFTFGSGLKKLEGLRAIASDQARAGWMPAVGLLTLVAGIVLVVGLSVADFRLHSILWGCFVIFYGVMFIGQGMLAATRDRPKIGDFASQERFGTEWVDCFASRDPVPNGPLFDEDEQPSYLRVRAIEVHNHAAWWSDHTRYWRNHDQFVAAVACALGKIVALRLDGLQPLDAERLHVARHRRKWRVQWLRRTRLAAGLLAAVLPLALVDRLGAIGEAVRPHLAGLDQWPLQPLVRPLMWGANVVGPALLGTLSVVVLVAATYLVIAVGWRWWDAHDQKAFFGRKDYDLCLGVVAVPVIAAVLMELTLLALLISIGLWPAPWHVDLVTAHYFFVAVVLQSEASLVLIGFFVLLWARRAPGAEPRGRIRRIKASVPRALIQLLLVMAVGVPLMAWVAASGSVTGISWFWRLHGEARLLVDVLFWTVVLLLLTWRLAPRLIEWFQVNGVVGDPAAARARLDEQALLHLARALALTGRRAAAIATYERLLKEVPDTCRATDIHAKITKLKAAEILAKFAELQGKRS